MKKLLFIAACLFMTSCIEEGHYTGNVVVIGKKASQRSSAFQTYTDYTLYGCTGEKSIKWWPTEHEYNQTNVGDTLYLFDEHYYEYDPR